MLSCKESTRLISDAKERQLSTKEKLALRLHILICKPCQRFSAQLDMLSNLAKEYTKKADSTDDKTS